MLIDSHCHISKKDYNDITKLLNYDNFYVINNGVDSSSNKEVVQLVKNYHNMFGAIGIHPEYANTYKEEDLEYIEAHLNDDKIVAIGEIGLDYHYGKENMIKQQELFIKQIELANKYQKTIIIHSRDSINDTYNILKEHLKTKAVIHCFSSSLEEAIKFTKLGILLGVGGVITFKNAKVLNNVVTNLDLKNILLETDSPYLTPEPFRGKQNEPINVTLAAKKIAEIKGLSVDEVVQITTKNAIKQFDLKLDIC